VTIGEMWGDDLDPLASPALLEQLPQLPVAMDADSMRPRLQRWLFDGRGGSVEASERPKAELGAGACSLQYPLRCRSATGAESRHLVLGTAFAEAGAAAAFASKTLAPLGERWASHDDALPVVTGMIAPLELALSVFPVTASLPTLAQACDKTRVADVLQRMLGDSLSVRDVELVVFRRTRGCVVRYHLSSAFQPIVYGKVGYAARSGAIEAATNALVESLAGSRSWIRVPRVLGRDETLELMVVEPIPGSRADMRSSAAVDALVDAAARTSAALHAAPLRIGEVRTLEDEAVRARDAVGLMHAFAPRLGAWLLEVVDQVERIDPVDAGDPVFSHGDFTPSQLLLDGDGVGVLDFDKLCQAEPARDLGRFSAYLRFALAKNGVADADALIERLHSTYQRDGGRVPHTRVEAYALASLVRMAARSWLQLKPSRLRVVCGVLRDRVEALHRR
jgi:Phosphotransferase enzyme family